MNTSPASNTIAIKEFLTIVSVDEVAVSSDFSSSHGAQETIGHGSLIGASKVSPQHPSQVLISTC
tara:strand:- start:130 stop:324 length:195 start_codon:yes stop_codon:yes gene_type:complete